MPRWKDLPDELDPQVREFTSQLRRLVDRGGLSVAAVADRTGYSKTSWERYLNGRLLAPKGAIVALAEVTGTNPVHLTTMWELAERAWSRSEMRHDMTMEAIRISQARAALGEFGTTPTTDAARQAGSRKGGDPTTARPGVAGPAGVSPTVPPQPAAPEQGDGRRREGSESGADAADSGGNSWRLAGYKGPSPSGGAGPRTGAHPRQGAGAGPGATGATRAMGAARAPGGGPAWTPGPPSGPGASGPYNGSAARGPGPGAPRGGGGAGKRRLTMFLAGAVGVLVVVGGVFYLTGGGGGSTEADGGASPSPSVSVRTDLPPGVKCAGEACTGKDAEAMGCTTDATAVTTAKTAVVGAVTVEVRYSKVCEAAWGRITQGVPGDQVVVTAGKAKQSDAITEAGDTIAYTPMVGVKDAGEAVACATLASTEKGCTP
ncbi:XRE family transcriptional regulator [Streptomyces griseoviridis]|uniref:XRE family transcriptional regulator n=1 Tax=Streptomyces griseoviridis TaxID=45398 RepID=A0A3S9ZCH8_STRGD|nr:XRE family transcriptional regulator [Streptomyces griseoviridis]AZS85524.1 XRE family transcriptional regulator [Streptomyces griseoviridis]QCN87630.1 hypothetical protein DDJ31_23950 [Streptomyces griseoviridis]